MSKPRTYIIETTGNLRVVADEHDNGRVVLSEEVLVTGVDGFHWHRCDERKIVLTEKGVEEFARAFHFREDD